MSLQEYEKRKREILKDKSLTSLEYEQKIKELFTKLGL